MFARSFATILAITALTSCDPLAFGEDVELRGEQITQSTIDEVSTATRLTFPAGTTGRYYVYEGSGIDDMLVTVLQIPNDSLQGFLSQASVQAMSEASSPSTLGAAHSWWQPGKLTEATHRSSDANQSQVVHLSAGRDGSKTLVYVAWHTM